jgi:hypothetical protein
LTIEKIVPSGFELRLDKNPYEEFIREIVLSYRINHRVKIPGILLDDIQVVLGQSAEIIIAANSEDKGISASEKTPQVKTLSRVRSKRASRTSSSINKTIDLITPLRSVSRPNATLNLITPPTLIREDD